MLTRDNIVGLRSADQVDLRPAPPTGPDGEMTVQDAVRDLITTYHDLNPSTITTLQAEPSPLEFMRYVSRNQPFVVRKGAASFPACKKWNAAYLNTVMSGQAVNVAITPYGNADSVIPLPDSSEDGPSKSKHVFIKPYEAIESFSTVLAAIQSQEQNPNHNLPTRYAQTQNDNLRNEYATLFVDVPRSIPFAHIALEKDPDAINFWLGNSSSTTALHKDNYENIYVQILGRKHFVLLPPAEAACVNERSVLAATYAPKSPAHSACTPALQKNDLCVRIDDPVEYVPFATWDPDIPDQHATPYSRLSQPLRVTLEEGDMLYLPALWYHKVSQSCGAEGLCCAVNYWYDMDFGGGLWSMAGFVRGVGLLGVQADEAEREYDDETMVTTKQEKESETSALQ